MYAIKWVITVKNWKYCWFFWGPLGANVDHTPQSYSTWGARELENLYINCHQSLFESYINSLALLAGHVWGQIKLWWFQKALRWRGADPGSWKLSRLALKWSEQGDKGGAMTGTAIPTNSFIANPVPIHYLLLNWYSHIFFHHSWTKHCLWDNRHIYILSLSRSARFLRARTMACFSSVFVTIVNNMFAYYKHSVYIVDLNWLP